MSLVVSAPASRVRVGIRRWVADCDVVVSPNHGVSQRRAAPRRRDVDRVQGINRFGPGLRRPGCDQRNRYRCSDGTQAPADEAWCAGNHQRTFLESVSAGAVGHRWPPPSASPRMPAHTAQRTLDREVYCRDAPGTDRRAWRLGLGNRPSPQRRLRPWVASRSGAESSGRSTAPTGVFPATRGGALGRMPQGYRHLPGTTLRNRARGTGRPLAEGKARIKPSR